MLFQYKSHYLQLTMSPKVIWCPLMPSILLCKMATWAAKTNRTWKTAEASSQASETATSVYCSMHTTQTGISTKCTHRADTSHVLHTHLCGDCTLTSPLLRLLPPLRPRRRMRMRRCVLTVGIATCGSRSGGQTRVWRRWGWRQHRRSPMLCLVSVQ